MNVIFVLCDTLTRDKLAPYHGGAGPYGFIKTPNLDRFATRAATFTNHWINSAPCMPARRDLFSGRIEFPWRSWGPRETFDPDWSVCLRDTAVQTALFSDHANLFDVGAGNYHHFFDTYQFVRGHFNDHYELVGAVQPGRRRLPHDLYKAARCEQRDPDDTFVGQNLRNVEHWLDDNSRQCKPFFVFVDEFDPHWPLDPPEPYRSMYLEDKTLLEKGLGHSYDRGATASAYSADELTWLQAQYAGKVTMVDHYLGRLFDCLDRNALWDDTMVVVTTDHGEYIGEYDQVSKGHGPSYPLFARIPLFIHVPGNTSSGARVDRLSCTVDLHATVMSALGAPVSPDSHGYSLLPLLQTGGTSPATTAAATATTAAATATMAAATATTAAATARDDGSGVARSAGRTDLLYGWWGKGFYWTDGRILLCKAPVAPGPLYQYGVNLGEKYVGLASAYFDRYAGAEAGRFLPHTDQPVFRVPSDGMAYSTVDADRDLLFDLERDPGCTDNLFERDAPLRQSACRQLVAAMRRLQVPEEHYARLGLTNPGAI